MLIRNLDRQVHTSTRQDVHATVNHHDVALGWCSSAAAHCPRRSCKSCSQRRQPRQEIVFLLGPNSVHTRCLVSRIRYHPNAAAHLASARTPSGKSECHHTSDSPVHSFETCIPAWIACSQPGEWHRPRAHLLLPTSRRGPVPVTELSQTSTEAPAALKVSHLLGTSNGHGISKT